MGTLPFTHVPGCLLILLFWWQSYSEGNLWLRRLGDKEFKNFNSLPTCRNVPDDFKKSSEWARTDECILLFSKENCQGSVYHLFQGFHRNLLEFKNRTLSFRACWLKEMQNEYKNPETIFHGSENQNTIAYNNPNSCQNLRQSYVEWGVSSVRTVTCILLFKEENCKGEHFKANAGHRTVLGSFENKTKSFKSCTNDPSKVEYRTKFYWESDFSGVIDDVDLHPGCNKNVFLNRNINSVESSACVRLFTDFDCSGNSFKIEAGRHTSMSNPNLPIKLDSVQSLRACNENYHWGPSQNPLKYEVAFSKLLENDFPEYFSYERVSTTCQNIHWSYVKKANSVETKKCIFLYAKENCEGLPYKVNPGYHSSFGDFNGKLVSFKACLKYDDEIEHRVKFYSSDDYTGIVEDIDVYPRCNKVDLRVRIHSLSTPICLEIYTDEICSNGDGYRVQAGNHSILLKSIKSLRPCNPKDYARFQQFNWWIILYILTFIFMSFFLLFILLGLKKLLSRSLFILKYNFYILKQRFTCILEELKKEFVKKQTGNSKQKVANLRSDETLNSVLNGEEVDIYFNTSDGKKFPKDAIVLPKENKGCAFILNIFDFPKGSDFEPRKGSEKDVKQLNNLLTILGFKTFPKPDIQEKEYKGKEEVIELLDKFLKFCKENKAKSVFVFIGSHGVYPNKILTSDVHPTKNGKVELSSVDLYKDIVSRFYKNNCKFLKGKPKMFLVQACQQFVEIVEASDSSTGLATDGKKSLDISNTIICLSTHPGGLSVRNIYNGSYLVQMFVRATKELVGKGSSYQEICQEVVATLTDFSRRRKNTFQVPSVVEYDMKKVYFEV